MCNAKKNARFMKTILTARHGPLVVKNKKRAEP